MAVINGTEGNDTLISGAGNDQINGLGGDDVIRIGGSSFGIDTFNGGDGYDVIAFSTHITQSSLLLTTQYVFGIEALDMNYYDILGTGAGDTIDLSGINTILDYGDIDLGDGADLFRGYQGNDAAAGGSGNDTMYGGGGNDTLTGGTGNDFLYGGTGNDVFRIGGAGFGYDIFDGGDGEDTISLTSHITVSSFLLTTTNVIDTEIFDMNYYDILGTGGADTVDLSGMGSIIDYGDIDLSDGDDLFIGHRGNDEVFGGAGDDTLRGNAGNDTLTGGTGDDLFVGGTGDDFFRIGGSGFGHDTFDGGDGTDIISLTSHITVSSFLLTTSNVINTEIFDMNYYDITGTGDGDTVNLSGIGSIIDYGDIDLGDGRDLFVGYRGNDVVFGGAGNDTLRGNAGNDTFTGGTGNDLLAGGNGNDVFRIGGSGFGQDTFDGGAGEDVISLTSHITLSKFLLTTANVINTETFDMNYYDINGTGSKDVINLSGMQNIVDYGDIDLGDGNDLFIGYRGNDDVFGGAGNDTLRGGAGNDRLNGGDGADTADYSQASGGVTVDLSKTVAQSIGGSQGSDTLISIENVNGSAHNDRLSGDARANTLIGNGGNDTLRGGGGNDLLNGGNGFDFASFTDSNAGVRVSLAVTGAQFISSNLGSDRLVSIEGLIGSSRADRLEGNAGANELSGGAGNDTLVGGEGNDVLNGGTGADTALYLGSKAATVSLATTAAQNTGYGSDRLIGIENISSGSGNDRLTGSAGNNTLVSNAGNDTLLGGAGNDTLDGGAGNDQLDGGAGRDMLVFSGAAAVTVSLANTGVQATGYGNDRILNMEGVTGGSGNDRLTGNGIANELIGNAGNDRLIGAGGNDTLNGGAGNDTLDGGNGVDRVIFDTNANIRVDLSKTGAQNTGQGNDVLIGIEQVVTGNGKDFLVGNGSANLLMGGGGADTLSGGAGNDRLVGGTGNDRLRGGTGNDDLLGGEGNDVFIFAAREGRDTIEDFQNNADKIQVLGNVDYSDLTITSSGNDTHVSFGGTTIVIENVAYFYIDQSDFIFS
ncbi:calcium-binding protein [Paracoccus caeni]|uniref:Calcium-binding protein n=1 Tax=Paracoccus caeni TaxID=657651 RepID=A0A934VTL7_9RHOB|nr:calcium-binding protein [Paracoccus caeni]MBK4214861.1 calcium-binding protein [Paracoccus caeni]